MADTDDKQQTFDFDKAARSKLIDQLEGIMPRSVQRSEKVVVNSRRTLIPVLHQIADPMNAADEWSYPGIERIRKRVGCGERMVSHAIAIWERLEVLTVERRHTFVDGKPRTMNCYRIDWRLLFDLSGFSRIEAMEWFELACKPPDRSASNDDQSASNDDQSATTADRSATRLRTNPFESKEIQLKESIGANGFFKIDIFELASPERVQDLWARNCDWHPQHYKHDEETRRRFFAFCRHTYRKRDAKTIEDPIALFSYLIKQGPSAFQFDDEHDMSWAKQAIAELDGVVLVGSASHQAAAVDVEWNAEDEQRRKHVQAQAAVMAHLDQLGQLDNLTEAQQQLLRDRPLDVLRQLNQMRRRSG